MISCFHKDRDLSDGNMGESAGIGSSSAKEDKLSDVVEGNIASRWPWVAAKRSEKDSSDR